MNKNKTPNGFYYSFKKLDEYEKLRNFISTKKVDIYSILDNLNISRKKCVYVEQVHGNDIAIVSKENKGETIKNVDALVTNAPGVCLCIRTADCLPLVFLDPTKNVLAVVHAGWKGTLKNISGKSIEKMIDCFKIDPKNLIVGIGPSIGPDDYLVKFDVASKFINSGYKDFVKETSLGQWKLDLIGVNLAQLKQTGVNEGSVEMSGISTFKSKDFYSHRRGDNELFITGGMISE